ncbi:hypothetical protein GCM10009858_22360 [Terrabacter carboxydivorans]|uniref:Uncharacterized protein n=1 Tax=Terrabacter carboxydivorans TaxID=619730 RepID=A0ABN3LGW2_9MICO
MAVRLSVASGRCCDWDNVAPLGGTGLVPSDGTGPILRTCPSGCLGARTAGTRRHPTAYPVPALSHGRRGRAGARAMVRDAHGMRPGRARRTPAHQPRQVLG